MAGKQHIRARRKSARRAFALVHVFLASLLLFFQAARLSEILLVQHAICEHGALLHVDSSADTAKDDSDEQGERLSPSLAPFEHEHCDAASILHKPDAFRSALPSPTLLCFTIEAEHAPLREARPVSILHEAPKASPPIAA